MSVPKTKATNMHVRIVAFVLLSCMLQPQWCSSTSAKWPDGNARGGSSAMVDSLRRSCRACLRSNHVGLSMRLRGGEEVRMEQVQAGSQGGNSLAKSRLEKMSEQILSRESKYQSDCSVASRDNIDRTRDIVGKHYHDHSHANAHQVQDKIDHQPDYNDLHQMSWCSRSSDASQNEMGLTSNPEQKVGMETLRLERGVSFEEEEVELKQTPAEEQAVLQQPTHVRRPTWSPPRYSCCWRRCAGSAAAASMACYGLWRGMSGTALSRCFLLQRAGPSPPHLLSLR
uniref:Uncharacterized protein n=1 Tax=Guillardia theta TaxID=55529 RepID=A0A7S4JUJ6_GUITH|mmetsp:Transcript_18869/g.61931  ORF Transcript_18869/g.61931 Transcript_18869/m.61931 type:complete len:284 (+) Transcript_18869:477-1328(+)